MSHTSSISNEFKSCKGQKTYGMGPKDLVVFSVDFFTIIGK